MVPPPIVPYVDSTHRQSKQYPTNRGCNLTVSFRQGLYWLGYGWSYWIACSPYGSAIVVAHNIGITIYKAKITANRIANPRFEQSFITTLARNRTVDTSMNTAFKCILHILGNQQCLQTVAELCAEIHITILLTLSIPPGKQSFQYMSGETRTYTLSHHGRTN